MEEKKGNNDSPKVAVATHVESKWKKCINFIKDNSILSGVTSGLIVALIIVLLTNFFGLFKSQLFIAVVSSKSLADYGLAKDFEDGFRESLKKLSNGKEDSLATDNWGEIKVEYFDDHGYLDRANEIASQILDDEKYVFFVGNSDSTLTAQTLDVFRKKPSSAPAMVIPIATAAEPISRANKSGYESFLRMPPNNHLQAIKIAQTVERVVSDRKEEVIKAAIYADLTNPVYSVNLSRDIAKKIRERGGVVLVEELIGTSRTGANHSFFTSLPVWNSKSKPNIIIYAGVLHHCLLLLDQISALEINAPLIFSDGCMEKDLLKYLKEIPNEAYLISAVKGEEGEVPSFKKYGLDAVELIRFIFNHEQLNGCDRADIADFIKKKREEMGIKLEGKNAGDYKFDKEGENTLIKFHTYDVTRGKLIYCKWN